MNTYSPFPYVMMVISATISHFRKSFPTSCENQGLTTIDIVSPTVFTQVLVETEGYPNGYCRLRGTGVEYKL